MQKTILALSSPAKSLLLALAAAAMALSPALASAPQFKMIHASDLAAMLQSNNPPVHVFDANTAKVRRQYGVIPGALLLSSSGHYDTGKVLPADRQAQLVFYCANTMCTASHSAAKRAIAAGFEHVFVMSDGIMGWKKSGHPTDSVAAAKAAPGESSGSSP